MSTNTLKESKESQIKSLLEKLCEGEGQQRKDARRELIALGDSTLEYINSYLEHPKHICRWEALRVVKEIAALKSIPVFLDALDDDKSDIRWIAAEGLIRMGKYSIKPLLNQVTKKYDSILVLNGAHHIIYELYERELLPENFPAKKLLSLLKNSSKSASLKVLVHDILRDLE
jgi:HEAT repeat protein